MTEKNNCLEVRLGMDEIDARSTVRVQLVDGDRVVASDHIFTLTPEVMRLYASGYGREIRKRKGPEASEGKDYSITMAVKPCEASLYEAFREGVTMGVEERERPDRYESQMSQALPVWYRIINRI